MYPLSLIFNKRTFYYAAHTAKPVKTFLRESKHDDTECALLFNLISRFSFFFSLSSKYALTYNDLISINFSNFQIIKFHANDDSLILPLLRKSVRFSSSFSFFYSSHFFPSSRFDRETDRTNRWSPRRSNPLDRRFPFVNVKSTFSE